VESKSIKGDQSNRGVKQGKQKARSGSVTIKPRQRGKQTIEIGFKGVRSIGKKVDLINSSDAIQKQIKNQLKRKGGKPPKGIIIIVRDKKGNEAAHVSIPSFVVNEKNVKSELEKFTKELKEEYSETQQNLSDEDGNLLDRGEGGGGGAGDEGYKDYNPDDIEEIEIKFIY